MEVVASARRRRTASAAVRGGRLVVRVPAHVDRRERDRLVDQLVARLRTRVERAPPPVPGLPDVVATRPTDTPHGPRGDPWLVDRADRVGRRHLGGTGATHVAWSSRMTTRWASCTVPTARVRVSDRLADAPTPVVEHLLLHELAHLHERGHGPAFAALVGRDPHHDAVQLWLRRRSALETAAALATDGLLAP